MRVQGAIIKHSFLVLFPTDFKSNFPLAAEEKNCRGAVQYSSHWEMGLWCRDVEGECYTRLYITISVEMISNWTCSEQFDQRVLWFQGSGNAADTTGWSLCKMAGDWWLQTQPLASCYRDVQVVEIALEQSNIQRPILFIPGTFSCCGWDML